jgi:predicted transcriptional regulator of viral defense system
MSLEKVLKRLEAQKVAKAAELMAITNRSQLRRHVEEGVIQSIGYGFYAHPSIDPVDAYLLVVAKYYPRAVISSITALSVYRLTDERIDQIDVDVPNETTLKNSFLRVHRVAKGLMVGVVRHEICGIKIRIYSRERALCGVYKEQPDGAIFLKALKRYVRGGQIDSQVVATLDKKLKTNVLKALMQELADG